MALGADVGIEPIIQQTADETITDVGEKLLNGNQQLWSATKENEFVGTIITQIEIRAGQRVLVVKYMAGRTFHEWLDILHETMTAFAKQVQCTAIETHSREALRKPLLAMGWKKVAVLYRVAVDG